MPPTASWYRLCSLADIARGPYSRVVCGHRLVAVQQGGEVAVLDGTCPHLGADLGKGSLTARGLVCPFHEWVFDLDGSCREGHGLRRWPSEIRYGHVFVFVGPGDEALFELPRHIDHPPEELYPAPPFTHSPRMHYSMAVAQAFDVRHFETLHGRRLTRPPEFVDVGRYCRKSLVSTEIVGSTFFDRATRLVAGRFTEFEVDCWGGNMSFVHARFGRGSRSYGLMITEPMADGSSRVETFVACRRRSGPARLFNPLIARLKAVAVEAMTGEDVPILDGIQTDDRHLGPGDRVLVDYFNWIRGLPKVPQSKEIPCAS